MTMALVVPDYRDREFAHVDKIAELDSVKIAIVSKDWFIESMRFQIPHAILVKVASPRDFFEGRADGADALLYGAEAGSAWSLLYPRFQVVTPFRTHISIPLVMPYGGFKDSEMDEFLDNWVMLSRYDGAYEEAYNYWILGEGTEVREPRWSVIRNVLHWVD